MNIIAMRLRVWAKAALLSAAAVFPFHMASADAPKWGATYFPNTTLTAHTGAKVRFYDDLLKGKSVAVNVMYTSCKDVCPLETARMAELSRIFGDRMGRDIFFYSITIDPEHDKPEILKAYAKKFGVGPGWLFLTGKKEDIKALTKKLGLSRASDSVNKDGHASSLIVGNVPKGQWMRNSAIDNPRFLAATIKNFLQWKDNAPAKSYAEAQPLNISKAQFTFESRCAACHTIGGGDRIGPDLLGVTDRRQQGWLVRYLREPDKMLAEGDPIATKLFKQYNEVRMPNLSLGSEDVARLIAYIELQSKPPNNPLKAVGLPSRAAK